MSQLPRSGSDPAKQTDTIAELVFRLPTPEHRRKLEKYRIEWEQVHGQTDLTRNYVSMWPREKQEFLFRVDPERYFRGLPLFVQDYIRGTLEIATSRGELDAMPDEFIRLYIQGLLAPRDHGRGI